MKKPSTQIDLGIVSDEISLDFNEALRYGLQWGLKIYELRTLRSGRVPNVNSDEFQEVRNVVSERNVAISALSPGIFKHPLSRRRELEQELSETLPRTIEMAKQLRTGLIIVFGFQKDPGEPASQYGEGLRFMERAAELAKSDGMRLAIENEPGFLCDSGSNTARFIKDLASPVVGANWDPCNGYGTAEPPFPQGYESVKNFIFNLHVKDTKEGSLIRCVPVGEGAIDWKGQLNAVAKDLNLSHITIETHCLPLIENSRRNVDVLRQYLSEIIPEEKVAK